MTTPSPQIRVDWTVPIWGVLGLLLQAAAIVWWGAGIDARVVNLESQQSKSSGIPEAIARMDERGRSNADTLKRIEDHLDILEQRH